ncbi:uncharacterized protein M6B38_146075 [Iris pallida]|uniref:Retrotransposon gag domain-containing protein n=1 Tax=Iris pallida TaxID=29817 RepID=A0AAX6F8U0_IRIPA|nr:uncharacterized protein M6B38_146075 [Iris pallida]
MMGWNIKEEEVTPSTTVWAADHPCAQLRVAYHDCFNSRPPTTPGLIARGAINLVSEPLDPVAEVSGERETSSSPETRSLPELCGRVRALEGHVHQLHQKFDRLLEELARSREGSESPNGRIVAPDLQMPNCLTPISGYNIQSGQTSWGQPTLMLELPDYDGIADVEEWLLRVGHYFNYYGVPDWDRVKICAVQMKGSAAHWFDWLMKIRGGMLSWEDFCQAIRIEFGPSQFTDHAIELKLLRQEGSVHDYDLQFRKLSMRVQGISESCLISEYIGGLKEEIRYEVQLANPSSIAAAMQVSRLQEAKFLAVKRTQKGTH